MKKTETSDVHDFSGHWTMNLPEQYVGPSRLRPTKPRAYKSIHSSEYYEGPAKQLPHKEATKEIITYSEVAGKGD